MPELPEVETVRRGLERLVVGKTIGQVRVRYAKMIGTGVDSFVHDLPSQTIERILIWTIFPIFAPRWGMIRLF